MRPFPSARPWALSTQTSIASHILATAALTAPAQMFDAACAADKDGLLEENLEDHPADQLLREALGLFDKCRAAKLEAQKQLPMRM